MVNYPIKFDIKPMFEAAGVPIPNPGIVSLYDRMEVPETNPNDEWITLGLAAMDILRQQGFSPVRVADVGTGNGILAIGSAHVFKPEAIHLTDIVESVLGPSERNLRQNLPPNYNPIITRKGGRDAEPLPNGIDFVTNSPPPLMVEDESILSKGLARTTLIEYRNYAQYAIGTDDPLLKWSVLPLYKFLLDTKQKLAPNGKILVLYSGRIPFSTIEEAYRRAGLTLEVPLSIIKKQQDPVYLKHYADYERRHLNGDTFHFYRYDQARELMRQEGYEMPGLIKLPNAEIKRILAPVRISANEAYKIALTGQPVAHVGYALVGRLPEN